MANTVNLRRIAHRTKNNYETWQMQVEALLTKRSDLWQYVSGDKEKLAAYTGTEAADRKLKP